MAIVAPVFAFIGFAIGFFGGYWVGRSDESTGRKPNPLLSRLWQK